MLRITIFSIYGLADRLLGHSVSLQLRLQFILVDSRRLPKEPKIKLNQWATNFRNAQIAQVNRLYYLIHSNVTAPTNSERQVRLPSFFLPLIGPI